MHCSIMGDVFDKEHVKEQSLILTGAYLYELTALSLGSRDLWMECPEDLFTLDALGEQGGGDDDRVVDRDIYHYDIFFLTWISKHVEDYFLAAHGSFFFIACQNTMEDSFIDPCIILLLAYGKNFVSTFIDFHTLTVTLQCIASQEGKLVTLLHDHYWANLYDGGSHLLCGLGKMFYHHMYVQLMHSNMYHMETCMINHVKRNIFPCTFLKQQLVKLRCHYWESYWYLLASLVTFNIFFIFF